MNTSLRKILTGNAVSGRLYCAARQAYHVHRFTKCGGEYFLNADEFSKALRAQGQNGWLDLHTADGLTITLRRNYGDAMTVAEIFLYDCYAGKVKLSSSPVIIDIGGFIGDFALYAVKRLHAQKVIVCEPSPQNWKLLLRNIANNGYESHIIPLNMAVTDGKDVMMNIDAPDECQCTVSAYHSGSQALSVVPGISLSQLLRDQRIDSVDLLKIDCEGGEYAILDSTPSSVFNRIRNIVFEFHDVDGGWSKLDNARQHLRQEGYVVHTKRGLVWASRM